MQGNSAKQIISPLNFLADDTIVHAEGLWAYVCVYIHIH